MLKSKFIMTKLAKFVHVLYTSVSQNNIMQELTNKLQRYLNQRFMLDSDQVKYGGGCDDDGGG